MTTEYDRLYDMEDIIAENLALSGRVIRKRSKKMRGTGVEPVCLSAPDPKSDGTPRTAPVSEAGSASNRQQPPVNATQSTTDSTTCGLFRVSAAHPGAGDGR